MLLRRRLDLEREVEEAREEWLRAAGAAADLGRRGLVLSGARRFRLAAFYAGGRAEVAVTWANLLGVVVPERAEVRSGEPADLVPLGASLPLALAADGYRQALAAAARYARAAEAHRRVSDELAATARRLRALEQRWIPLHEAALARLDLVLDEAEREDAARVHRLGAGSRSGR